MGDGGWIGVDLDGTLAEYDHWRGAAHIGAPVPAMLERVKRWIAEGYEVRIFTARVGTQDPAEIVIVMDTITEWVGKHIGSPVGITNMKDFGMIELWDDRAVTVEMNTGRPLAPSTRGL